MKIKVISIFALLVVFSANVNAQFFKDIQKAAGDAANKVTGSGGSGGFTQSEAAQAIKEALTNGITKGVEKVSVANGYLGNPTIKIPFPPQAQRVEDALRTAGMGNMVDNVVNSMNHAAENAAKAATPIFVNSIKQMTVNDAIGIVNNQQKDAATRFLERTTTDQLVAAFKPSIKDALDKVNATKYWAEAMGAYNRIPFVSKVETDLPEYVTRKAISGLFYMISLEEANIRKDPLARTSDLLKKVFGGVK